MSKSTTFEQFIPLAATSEGTVSLDDTRYGCSDTATIMVSDIDLSGTAIVTVSSLNGDSEVVTLNELPTVDGVFQGTLPINDQSVNIQNGVLNIVDGTSITVTYSDANIGNGSGAVISDTADIDCSGPPDPLTELFDGTHDLTYKKLTFRPDNSNAGYRLCVDNATVFPSPTGGATTLPADDDAYNQIYLQGGKTISLFGVSYGSVFIGTNGYLTFGGGDYTYATSASAHFSLPRVSGMFDDLDPSTGGTVSYEQFADRFVVSYINVPEFFHATSSSFQIELFFNGVITITHLSTNAEQSLIGLSYGTGVPEDFSMSDLSAELNCVVAPVPVEDIILIRNFFDLLDINDDGQLDYYESIQNQETFDFLDTDGNDYLSMEELLDFTLGSSGSASHVYVDFAYTGDEYGTAQDPFNTVVEALGYAAEGGTLHIKAGSTSARPVFNKPITLRRDGASGVVRLGAL